MSLLVFLNELSYRDVDAHREEIATTLDGFVTLLQEIRRHRRDTALVTDAEFMNLGAGTGFSIRQWQADGRNREAMRRIQRMRTMVPPGILPANKADDTSEYTYNGSAAFGLGAAHINEGLGVSLSLSTLWDASRLPLSRSALVENDTGDIVLVCTDEEVRHASQVHHVTEHRDWMCRTGLHDVHTGSELWRIREEVFPRLRFLPRVVDDLEGLRREWLSPAKELLAKLEEAVTAWDPEQATTPVWSTKVTPEHEQRKRLCWFDDPVAGRALFDLHARLTPGAGRLHFRWDATSGQVVIGYIGQKLI